MPPVPSRSVALLLLILLPGFVEAALEETNTIRNDRVRLDFVREADGYALARV